VNRLSKSIWSQAILAAIFTGELALSMRALAQAVPVDPTGTVQVNFPNEIELKVLVDYVSQRLGVRILYDSQNVNKKVNIRAPGEIPASTLLGVLESVLKMNGLALVDADVDGWKRIVQATQLPSIAETIGRDESIEQMPRTTPVTQAFVLQHADANQLKQTLTPFLTQGSGTGGSNIIAQKEGNLLVVTDYASNVMRIAKLIDLIDGASTEIATEFIDVKNVQAGDLAQRLTGLVAARGKVQGLQASSATVDVTADERTNQLLVVGTLREVEEVKRLIERLDVPLGLKTEVYPLQNVTPDRVDRLVKELIGEVDAKTSYKSAIDTEGSMLIVTTTEQIHERIQLLSKQLDSPLPESQKPVRFYRLKHVTVTDLLDILQGIDQSNSDRDTPRRANVGRLRINPGQQLPGQNIGPGAPAPIQNLPTTPAFREPATGQPDRPASEPQAIFRPGDARLTADPNTNTLIVVAEPAVQQIYEELIKELDRPRPQVLIEAKIIVIDTSDNFSLGVEISGGDREGAKRLFSFSSFGLSDVDRITGALTIIPGLGFNGTLVDPSVADVVVRALTNHRRARVLSAPKILVNDNATGVLTSVAEVPFTSVNASQTVATTSFAGFADAGTTILVTPHISEGDHLQLEYRVTVNNFTGTGSDGVPPPRQTDEIESTVTIPDGNTVIVGGLNRINKATDVTSMPFIENVPILKYIASNRTNADQRSTLFIFLKPVILRDDKFKELKFLSDRDVHHAELPGRFPTSQPVLIR
jgi:general secretion pathway protein D